jgi:cystathionine beta-lyase
MKRLMEDECGIAVDYGEWFGGNEYAGCIRVNLATRRENIEEAAERIIRTIKK